MVVPIIAHGDAALSVFLGRDPQIEDLVRSLDPNGRKSVATVVSAVAGLGGVGKTALARQAASTAVGRGWFRGAAVFVDMHGYDSAAKVGADIVFGPLLRAMGVDPWMIPPLISEQARMYHQLLADLAKQRSSVLFVFDNVSSPAQIASLMPTHRVHRALVTSRHTLSELEGVRVMELKFLTVEASVAVLDEVLRRRDPEDRRVEEQTGDAEELARLGGRLPLALQIIAAMLADDPNLPLSSLASELANTETRLSGLAHGERAVAAAFDLSWAHLTQHDAPAARIFRLLSANPGPEFSVAAAAALADELPQTIRRHLRTLHRAHLIESGTAAGRWGMHDLVRLYAQQLPQTGQEIKYQAAAVRRVLNYYLAQARSASEHVTPSASRPTARGGNAAKKHSAHFGTLEEALAWLDTERPNLTAAVTLAHEAGHPEIAVDLAIALYDILQQRRHFEELISVCTVAVQGAAHMQDKCLEAWALDRLGNALGGARRFAEAVAAHERSVALYAESNDAPGQTAALNNLGNDLNNAGRTAEAIIAHEKSVALYAQFMDRHGQAGALNNLGNDLLAVERTAEAIIAHEQAVALYAESHDRGGQAAALHGLGNDLQRAGQVSEAITTHEQSVALYGQLEDWHGQAGALNGLGNDLRMARRLSDAVTAHERSAALYAESQDQYGLATALNNLGYALREMGHIDTANDHLEHALAIFTDTGAHYDRRKALWQIQEGKKLHGVKRWLLARRRREDQPK